MNIWTIAPPSLPLLGYSCSLLLRVYKFFPAETPELDPVCSLSDVHKLRLCASLFGAPTFLTGRKLKFAPIMDNVVVACAKKEISFISPGSDRYRFFGHVVQEVMIRRRFEEWVIGCKALTQEGSETIQFVSRGTDENEIFVYSPVNLNNDERVFLYSIFVRVSVADKLRKDDWPVFLVEDVED